MSGLGNFLRIMVFLSSLLLLAGGIIFLYAQGKEQINYHQFDRYVTEIRSGMPLMKTGITLLALTPLFTMMFTCFMFLVCRDWLYAIISFIVMSILAFSLLVYRF